MQKLRLKTQVKITKTLHKTKAKMFAGLCPGDIVEFTVDFGEWNNGVSVLTAESLTTGETNENYGGNMLKNLSNFEYEVLP